MCHEIADKPRQEYHHNGDQAARRPQILFDLRSLIWGFWLKLYDCSLHHFRARKYLIKRALLTFSSISNCVAEIWNRDFPKLGWGCQGWAHSTSARGFLVAEKYGLSLAIFELFSWLQKCFLQPACHRKVDNYCSRSYNFIERQKQTNHVQFVTLCCFSRVLNTDYTFPMN